MQQSSTIQPSTRPREAIANALLLSQMTQRDASWQAAAQREIQSIERFIGDGEARLRNATDDDSRRHISNLLQQLQQAKTRLSSSTTPHGEETTSKGRAKNLLLGSFVVLSLAFVSLLVVQEFQSRMTAHTTRLPLTNASEPVHQVIASTTFVKDTLAPQNNSSSYIDGVRQFLKDSQRAWLEVDDAMAPVNEDVTRTIDPTFKANIKRAYEQVAQSIVNMRTMTPPTPYAQFHSYFMEYAQRVDIAVDTCTKAYVESKFSLANDCASSRNAATRSLFKMKSEMDLTQLDR